MSLRHPASHHALVLLQLTGVAMAIVPPLTRDQSGLHWLVAAAAGMALGVITLIHNHIGNFSIYPRPRDGARLITTGPYRCVRHPMYGALVIMMIGIAGYNGGARPWLGAVLVTAVVVTKALVEERLLISHFPGYPEYARRTWRFIPFVV